MSGIVSSIFGGSKPAKIPAPAALPPVPQATVMPVADDAALSKSKRAATIAASERSGRASTILSDSSDDTLG